MIAEDSNVIISMTGIKKSFPGVLALDDVSLEVRKGEVLALVGENGAGKSTLMKILSGLYHPEEGVIRIDGKVVEILDVRHAQRLGVSTIWQEPSLAPDLNAVQNIYLGREIVRPVLGKLFQPMDEKEMYKRTESIYKEFLPTVEDISIPVSELGALKNRVIEIVKALSVQASVIIMDEPTAALAEHERIILFDFIRKMKERGVAIIYITHHLRELFGLVDRISVMRDGKNVETVYPESTNIDHLVSLMVGRTVSKFITKEKVSIGDEILSVSNLNRTGILEDINLFVRSGEIVGLSGLAGSGRTETVRAIVGADYKNSGTITVDGKEIKISSPRDAINAGIGLLPENRKLHGALIDLSIKHNITMCALNRVLSKKFILKKKKESNIASEYISRLGIKTPSENRKVRFLSGGNQQKVILAKWLFTQPKILIFDEPTQGIDVGAKVEVYNLIADFVRNGGGVILISSELPELMGLSDRIYVMHKGKIAHEFSREEATEENITLYASGGHE